MATSDVEISRDGNKVILYFPFAIKSWTMTGPETQRLIQSLKGQLRMPDSVLRRSKAAEKRSQ